jgi:hypothetical protein
MYNFFRTDDVNFIFQKNLPLNMSDKSCDVKGCTDLSFKTVPADLAKKVFTFDDSKTKVHLCKAHYKEYKKKTKQDREVDRMDWV